MKVSDLLVSCEDCTKMYELKNKKPPCETCVIHKDRPDVLPSNTPILNLLNSYSGMIYNGESIDSNGIKLVMELEHISEPHKPLFTRKIIAYFSKVRELQNTKLKEK